MKIYAVTGTTDCTFEWDTDYGAYPITEMLDYFSTREKAMDFINSYKCNEIHTLFKGSLKARETDSGEDWREFVSDDECYDWYAYTIGIEEIEIKE